eukprot:TRINITY_DN112281_c0_g1_i1.p1 TRINITY_DN112281_c0_g1~~TRINITY_DN112281_c0_g1_i1.p1  ORF type:complete len:428 (+),score=50.67 TRINITY_DN112281_c0_g1_i1:183-1466(+)
MMLRTVGPRAVILLLLVPLKCRAEERQQQPLPRVGSCYPRAEEHSEYCRLKAPPDQKSCTGSDVLTCGQQCCWSGSSDSFVDFSDSIASADEMLLPAPERRLVGVFVKFFGFLAFIAFIVAVGFVLFLWKIPQLLDSLGGTPGLLLLDEERLKKADTDSESEIELPSTATCPPHWENRDISKDFDERYDAGGAVVRKMQEMFDATWKDISTRDRHTKTMPKGVKVINVQRIEDRSMWAAYLEHKESIRRKRGYCMAVNELDGDLERGTVQTEAFASSLAGGVGQLERDLNEHYLFHGTSPQAADVIAEDGFLLSLAGSKTGTMFGNGCYFAECSSKADEYAHTGKGVFARFQAILVCRVCCGEMKRLLQAEPKVDKILKTGKYDSVLGDREASRGTYREFVVYSQRQIYPEYVVIYKRVEDDSDSDE